MLNKQPVLETHAYLLTEKQVCERVALSRVSLWKLRRLGKFPNPVSTPLRCRRWHSTDIDTWMNSLVENQP